eukprot:Opistho-1_new@20681
MFARALLRVGAVASRGVATAMRPAVATRASVLPYAFRTPVVAATYATKSAKPAGLADILRDELKYEAENYSKPEELTAFLAKTPFKITEDKPGSDSVKLVRDFNGEQIEILLRVDPQSDMQYSNDEDDAREGSDDEVPDSTQPPLSFLMRITKNGKKVEMTIFCDPEFEPEEDTGVAPFEIAEIRHVVEGKDEGVYPGPIISELDEKLQDGLQRFVTERGVDREFIENLRSLYDDKEQREYMRWLEQFQSLVKA